MNTINQTILTVMQSLDQNGGSISMATLGSALKKCNIDVHALTGMKLGDYMANQMLDEVELGELRTSVRIKNVPEHTSVPLTINSSTEENMVSLCSFARINWQEIAPALANMARPEDWSIEGDTRPYALLVKYVKTQWSALWYEGKILRNDPLGKVAFHTALYTQKSEPIFMILTKQADGFYEHEDICYASSTGAKRLVSTFGKLPERAEYGPRNDRYFDTKAFTVDCVDLQHIFHRTSRFPKAIWEKFSPVGIDVARLEHKDFDEMMYRALMRDDQTYNSLSDLLMGAIRRGIASCEESQSEAVLAYNYTNHNLTHLIPLRLCSTDVDLVLLVQLAENGTYFAPTVLTKSMARTNARTISRIGCSWLN